MTPLRRKLREWLERFLKRFYEGPRPPARYRDLVLMFRRLNPDATADQWEAFAHGIAESAYQDGYTRGYEWTERDLDAKPKHDPDVLAELHRHDWDLNLSPEERVLVERGDPNDPLNHLTLEQREMYLRQIAGPSWVDSADIEPPEPEPEDDAEDEPA